MFRLAAIAMIFLALDAARAQDMPGIEVCTKVGNLEKRTSCLQSNINFLQEMIAKNAADARQKLNAANNEIAVLKNALAALQASFDKLQAAAKKPEAK